MHAGNERAVRAVQLLEVVVRRAVFAAFAAVAADRIGIAVVAASAAGVTGFGAAAARTVVRIAAARTGTVAAARGPGTVTAGRAAAAAAAPPLPPLAFVPPLPPLESPAEPPSSFEFGSESSPSPQPTIQARPRIAAAANKLLFRPATRSTPLLRITRLLKVKMISVFRPVLGEASRRHSAGFLDRCLKMTITFNKQSVDPSLPVGRWSRKALTAQSGRSRATSRGRRAGARPRSRT